MKIKSAPRAALKRSVVPSSIAPRAMASLMVTSRRVAPTTRRANLLSRSAMPNEPPIKPTPTMHTVSNISELLSFKFSLQVLARLAVSPSAPSRSPSPRGVFPSPRGVFALYPAAYSPHPAAYSPRPRRRTLTPRRIPLTPRRIPLHPVRRMSPHPHPLSPTAGRGVTDTRQSCSSASTCTDKSPLAPPLGRGDGGEGKTAALSSRYLRHLSHSD